MSRAFSIICGRDDACNTFEDSLKKNPLDDMHFAMDKNLNSLRWLQLFIIGKGEKEPIYCTMHIPSLKALQDRNY